MGGGLTLPGGGSADYILIRDEKAASNHGGTFTAAAWQTRVLNTEVSDDGGHASLASNQITLAAGTYEFKANLPCHEVGDSKARLANITDSIYVYGENIYATAGGGCNINYLSGKFTIAAPKVFELQHRCSVTGTNTGFGFGAYIGVIEVFASIEFRKVG